ncbi:MULTISPECIES: mycofactocin-coupled SDR family oxidoreductase [Pseudonocardia]|uniref:Short-chain type dehydrogenase/reductase n=2 Tax=Pseudonocardia TaxID=1847 RepID=A0ABQ0S3I2_9PSEU|nr:MULTISPECIES: mycofactocin-coupled SDR family oxidoreductase [Pseudonocardia]OSY35728.1 putative short-chain type dehydrogenase/reductase [Pseudonocardia autotrophica]TDN74580.1 (+)-trans-carveol dehydrogenase [Pseudonocardia autotrophica]BBG05348.1 putative short-chain type dehydrogenase/reductase [Pseudonocardia autotrophica]GEC27472.1 putative short-chain type dehydrogenase/reductase [Pseudonocardia saturnea]
MTGRIAGRVALVTGAARGQGRSHAVRLAEEGAAVIAVDICRQIDSVPYRLATSADLERTVDEVRAVGGRIVAVEADVRDPVALGAAVGTGVEEFGRLDIACANAGILSFAGAGEMGQTTWQDVIDVNLTGAWNTAQAAIPHLTGAGGGSIVLTSSAAGLRARPNLAHYVTAKHGLTGMMRSLAIELAPRMIRVNCVLPTGVDTDMVTNPAMCALFRPDLPSPGPDDIRERCREMNAMPVPWVEVRDVSNAVLFLTSDEARYVTGALLPVDAGATL